MREYSPAPRVDLSNCEKPGGLGAAAHVSVAGSPHVENDCGAGERGPSLGTVLSSSVKIIGDGVSVV